MTDQICLPIHAWHADPPVRTPLVAVVPPSRNRGWGALASRHGRTGVAPFIANPGCEVMPLLGGRAAAGFSPVRRWAVTAGDVVAPAIHAEAALTEYLQTLDEGRRRPAFVAVADPEPYRRRGLHAVEIADEAVIDLASFTLKGPKRANLRHSATSAVRAGLTVVPFTPSYRTQVEEVSKDWLRTKRGGELGFTLSRLGDIDDQLDDHTTDVWLGLDAAGRVEAWCSWRHYLGGQGRVLDVMRRRCDANNPAMDHLMVRVLERYRDAGLSQASLASVPREHGAAAERIYPCRSLRAYKQKFAPQWQTRWLVAPSRLSTTMALMAVSSAYCPGGLLRAVRRNG